MCGLHKCHCNSKYFTSSPGGLRCVRCENPCSTAYHSQSDPCQTKYGINNKCTVATKEPEDANRRLLQNGLYWHPDNNFYNNAGAPTSPTPQPSLEPPLCGPIQCQCGEGYVSSESGQTCIKQCTNQCANGEDPCNTRIASSNTCAYIPASGGTQECGGHVCSCGGGWEASFGRQECVPQQSQNRATSCEKHDFCNTKKSLGGNKCVDVKKMTYYCTCQDNMVCSCVFVCSSLCVYVCVRVCVCVCV